MAASKVTLQSAATLWVRTTASEVHSQQSLVRAARHDPRTERTRFGHTHVTRAALRCPCVPGGLCGNDEPAAHKLHHQLLTNLAERPLQDHLAKEPNAVLRLGSFTASATRITASRGACGGSFAVASTAAAWSRERRSTSRLERLVDGAARRKAKASPGEPPALCTPAAMVTEVCSHTCSGKAARRTRRRTSSGPVLPEPIPSNPGSFEF